MSESKKFYYLRLKETFFDSPDLKFLQSLSDGYQYTIVLLKIYLLSLKDDGRLIFKNGFPYTPALLATVLNHPVGVIEKALKIFSELGLIQILENGTIYISDIPVLVGRTSSEGERKRIQRKRIEDEIASISESQSSIESLNLNSGTFVPVLSDNHPPELREKRTEKRKNKKKSFVPPTEDEIQQFCASKNLHFNVSRFLDYYALNDWKAQNGRPINWKQRAIYWDETERRRNGDYGRTQERSTSETAEITGITRL